MIYDLSTEIDNFLSDDTWNVLITKANSFQDWKLIYYLLYSLKREDKIEYIIDNLQNMVKTFDEFIDLYHISKSYPRFKANIRDMPKPSADMECYLRHYKCSNSILSEFIKEILLEKLNHYNATSKEWINYYRNVDGGIKSSGINAPYSICNYDEALLEILYNKSKESARYVDEIFEVYVIACSRGIDENIAWTSIIESQLQSSFEGWKELLEIVRNNVSYELNTEFESNIIDKLIDTAKSYSDY